MIDKLIKNIKINPFAIFGLLIAGFAWITLSFFLSKMWTMHIAIMLILTILGYSSVSMVRACKSLKEKGKPWCVIAISAGLLIMWVLIFIVSISYHSCSNIKLLS